MPDILTRHIYCIKQLFACKINSIIFERLSKNGRAFEVDTTRHLSEYGETGLRTLALSYRVLEESEYSAWNVEFIKAKTSIGADREAQLERVAELMEKDLILVGATAVEDKLQRGVSSASMVSRNILLVIFAMLAKI
jgi:phospholipid-translocating ATPase